MELIIGLEPTTCWLQISCSTIEPYQHICEFYLIVTSTRWRPTSAYGTHHEYSRKGDERRIHHELCLDGVGGRCGIRTHGSFTFFSFQDWCYRPLSQPSIWNRALFRQPLFGTRCEPSYLGRNKEWEVCMVNAQPLNHNMIISYIKEFVNYLLKYLQFCNNYIHWLYFEFVYISLQ